MFLSDCQIINKYLLLKDKLASFNLSLRIRNNNRFTIDKIDGQEDLFVTEKISEIESFYETYKIALKVLESNIIEE